MLRGRRGLERALERPGAAVVHELHDPFVRELLAERFEGRDVFALFGELAHDLELGEASIAKASSTAWRSERG